MDGWLECVINLSEGRRLDLVATIGAAARANLLDTHSDTGHHRCVLTLGGPARAVEAAARAVTAAALTSLDLSAHAGAHPRIGVVDVVPFVPLAGSTMAAAVAARDRFCTWAGAALRLPCFRYGPERSLPSVRSRAFTALRPDCGPDTPHPTGGACAVGARGVLVAWNLWLADADVAEARRMACALRAMGPAVRSLGLDVGGQAQVSCNLVDPGLVGPGAILDVVERVTPVERCELVGLLPAAVLAAEQPERWARLDLSPDRTIEARLFQAGLDGGRFDVGTLDVG